MNYFARFAPNLAEVTAPLRHLLRRDTGFKWDTAHEKAFQQMKETITAEPGPVLAYFDPKKEVTLEMDASKNGLGVVSCRKADQLHTQQSCSTKCNKTTPKLRRNSAQSNLGIRDSTNTSMGDT